MNGYIVTEAQFLDRDSPRASDRLIPLARVARDERDAMKVLREMVQEVVEASLYDAVFYGDEYVTGVSYEPPPSKVERLVGEVLTGKVGETWVYDSPIRSATWRMDKMEESA